MLQPLKPVSSTAGPAQDSLLAALNGLALAVLLSLLMFASVPVRLSAQSRTLQFAGSVQVGQSSAPQIATVTVTANGRASTPLALAQGVDNGEFKLVGGGTCSAGSTYATGEICTAQVIFAPLYPGRRDGVVLLKSDDGRVLGSTLLSGSAAGALPLLTPSPIATVAGDRAWIYRGDGVAAVGAPIFLPQGLAVDAAGNLFLADSSNNRLRRVDAATGVITTVVGNGTPGYNGDGLRGTDTSISQPAGVVLDGAGNLYFADTGNHVIRRYDTVSNLVSTVAGSAGVQGYSGDGGPATAARLTLPEGLALQSNGDLVIADTGNNVIRTVSATSGLIQTIAGTGAPGFSGDGGPATLGLLNSPWGVALLSDGSILFADFNNNRVRSVSPAGLLSTLGGNGIRGFGGDNSSAVVAQLSEPTALAVDPAGDVYIADSGNNRVRVIGVLDGKIRTFVGDGNEAFAGDGGAAIQASLYGPYGLLFSASGDLFISDMFHNRVRRIHGKAVTLSYSPMRVGSVSYNQTVDTWNVGNLPLNFGTPALVNAILDEPAFAYPAGATPPCFSAPVDAGAACAVDVEFAPKVTGTPTMGSVTINSDAGGDAPIITVQGTVLSVEPTSTLLTTSTNPSPVGAALTLTAQVTSADRSRQGKVTFSDGQTVLCTVDLDGSGIANCQTSTLTLGQHSLTAKYAGDTNNAASASAPVTEVVKQRANFDLTAGPNPAIVSGTVTLRLTTMTTSGTPTGTVSFFDGDLSLGSAVLDSHGTATVTTHTLSAGQHTLAAQYAGDATFFAADAATSEQVNQANTATMLSAASTTITVGSSLTLSAQVAAPNGPAPSGTVSFREGSTALGAVNVDGAGMAVLTSQFLTTGVRTITATYSGDSSDATSISAPLAITVTQIPTLTSVASDVNPLGAGAILHLTAAVTLPQSATASGAVSGQVTFRDGSVLLGTDQLDATGHATLAVPGMSVGPHMLTATYTGNTSYGQSTSAALTETVLQTSTTVSLTTSGPTSLAGVALHLASVVTSSTGIPTGQITLREGGAVLSQTTLDAKGNGSFSVSTLSVGTHSLSAVYTGDVNYTSSNSAPVIVNIALAQPSLALAGPQSPVDFGIAMPVTVSLAGNGVTPTGSLVLRDGDKVFAVQPVSQTGTVLFSITTLGLGTHVLTAAYSGDTYNASAVSSPLAVSVRQAPTSLSLKSSVNPVTTGSSLTLVASVTSESPQASGTVVFLDGGVTLGSAGLSANGTANVVVNSLSVGTHTLTATYSGDAGHAASSSSLAVLVVSPSTATLTATPNPAVSGVSVSFTARISGPASDGAPVPTGQLVFRDGSVDLAPATLDAAGTASFSTSRLPVGVHAISVAYAGDGHYATSSASLAQTVVSATTQITLQASANPAAYAGPLTLSARVSSDGGIATGRLVFTEGSTALGSALLDGDAAAQITLSTLSPGVHTLMVSYPGDGKASASVSAPLSLVVKQTTTLALASSSNPALTLSPVTLMANVSNAGVTTPTGAVTFSDGTITLGTVPLDPAGRATLVLPQLAAGMHPITATYAGDDVDFNSGTQTPLAQVVERRATTTGLTSSATNAANPQQVTLIAVVRAEGTDAPGGTVTFLSGIAVLGSSALDPTGVATLTVNLEVKQESVTGTYAGDAHFAGSSSNPEVITAGAATQFTLAVSSGIMSFASKQHSTVTVTLQSVRGFNDKLELGCLGLPYAATCTFSSPTTTLEADGSSTVQLTVDTGNPLGAGAQASRRELNSHAPLLCLFPVAMLFGFRRRRGQGKALPRLVLVLCAAVLASAGSGCSGLQVSGTPPGTYAFKVTASGVGSGATQSQTIQLTVTR